MAKTLAALKPKDGDVLLMVGTMKGAFLFRSDAKRKKWQRAGPFFPGHEVYAMAFDGRGERRRLWAGVTSGHFGPGLRSSDDFGATWTNPESIPVKFPSDAGVALKRVWQIELGRPDDANTLYCGVEPAALFESRDGGRSWTLNKGLFDHPHRKQWQPGGGGLGLHTVVPHPTNPRRIHVAISTGGVYRTDDGGVSWHASNKGVRAEFMPDKHPEFGQCVHKIAMHPSRPDTFFLQNHWGLYRSDDAGDSWKDIANGVPSDFGFPVVVHAQDPDTAYIVPLKSDEFRVVPDAKLRVYRTRNGGKSWEPLSKGLPQEGAYELVLRDGLAADAVDPCGVYFGTRSGKLFASANEGAKWSMLADGLPPVTCVKTSRIGDGEKPKKKAKKK
jgi:hypothetical protein